MVITKHHQAIYTTRKCQTLPGNGRGQSGASTTRMVLMNTAGNTPFTSQKSSRGIAESGGIHSLGGVPGPERGYEREMRTFRLIHTCSTLATLRFSLRHTNRGYHMRV